MADNTIKFTADATQAKKAVQEIVDTINKGTGPKKIKIDIDDTKIKQVLKEQEKTYREIKRGIQENYVKAQGMTGEARRMMIDRINDQKRDLKETSQTINGLSDREEVAAGRGGGSGTGGAALSALGLGVLRKSPWVAAAAYVGGKAYKGWSEVTPLAQKYTDLAGMGLSSDAARSAVYNSAKGLGFNPDDTRGLMQNLLTSTGVMNPSLLRQSQTFSRAYGIDTGILGGTAGTLRQNANVGDDIVKRQAEILASAINSHIEKGRLGEYIQETNKLIEHFAGAGGGTNTTQIASMMALMTRQQGIWSPGFTGNMLQGVDSMIRNPSKQMNPIVLNTLAQTLSQGGYKGSTPLPLALMTLQSTGLFGKEMTAQNFPNLARTGDLKKFQDIYNAYDPISMVKNLAGNITQSAGKYGLVGAANLSGLNFKEGAPGVAEFLAGAKSPFLNKDQARKMLQNAMPQAEKTATDIVQSIDGQTVVLESMNKVLTEKVAQSLQQLNNSVTEIDNKIMGRVTEGSRDNRETINGVKIPDINPKTGDSWGRPRPNDPWYKLPFLSGNLPDPELAKKEKEEYVNQQMKRSNFFAPYISKLKNFLMPGAGASTGGGSGGGGVSYFGNNNLGFKSSTIYNQLADYESNAPVLAQALENTPMSMLITELRRKKGAGYGVGGSLHYKDKAADISVAGMSPADIAARINYFNSFKGLHAELHTKGQYGATGTHIHVSDLHDYSKSSIMPNDVSYSE